MGCGISKFGSAQRDGDKSGIRPINLTIDDVSKSPPWITNDLVNNNNAAGFAEQTICDWNQGGRKSVSSQNNNLRKSVSCDEEPMKVSFFHQKAGIYVSPTPEDGHDKPKKLEAREEERGIEAKDQLAIKSTADPKMESDEEEGGRISDYDGPFWISSPSFREYCIVDCDSEDSMKGYRDGSPVGVGNNYDQKKTGNLTLSNEAEGSCGVIKSECRIPSVKRGRRRNLRQVLTMHRPNAVKNLFSVTTCYHHHTASSASNAPSSKSNSIGKPV